VTIVWVPAQTPDLGPGTRRATWWQHEPCGTVCASPSVNKAPEINCFACDPDAPTPADTWALLYTRETMPEDPNLPLEIRLDRMKQLINDLIDEAHAAGVRCPLDWCDTCTGINDYPREE
jgi:hypothetical protein